jgi:thiol-disulfide isomerase/thioredoxin
MSITDRRTSAVHAILAVLLSILAASLPGGAGAAPDNIAVLDSLTGDTTIVEGKVVYVDFWASWCVPCRQSFPWMMDLVKKYGDSGLVVVAINVDRKRSDADKFLKDTDASLPVVFDPAGKLAKLYDLQVMPTSFVYGRDGKLKLKKDGFNADETESVESLIRELLEEKPDK